MSIFFLVRNCNSKGIQCRIIIDIVAEQFAVFFDCVFRDIFGDRISEGLCILVLKIIKFIGEGRSDLSDITIIGVFFEDIFSLVADSCGGKDFRLFQIISAGDFTLIDRIGEVIRMKLAKFIILGKLD